MKHHTWMLAACLLPLALVFAVPSFGIRSDAFLALFLVACFAMHLLMMKGHGGGKDKGDGHDDAN